LRILGPGAKVESGIPGGRSGLSMVRFCRPCRRNGLDDCHPFRNAGRQTSARQLFSTTRQFMAEGRLGVDLSCIWAFEALCCLRYQFKVLFSPPSIERGTVVPLWLCSGFGTPSALRPPTPRSAFRTPHLQPPSALFHGFWCLTHCAFNS
jgi:hypothetical protein